MQLQRHSNQSILSFESSQQIGSGGEGAIYALAKESRLAAKVYHRSTAELEQKLLVMFRNPPDDPMRSQGHASIAWPVDLLRTIGETSHICGFLMPRVTGTFSVIDLFVPKSRLEKCPLFTYQYLHRAAANIAAAIAPLHARGYVVGDINESNILVSTSALATLVDCDSFQVRDAGGRLFRCGVGKAEFTPPELQGANLRDMDRTPQHDLFGLAVLLFQLLMEGAHPYAGQYKGEGEPPGIAARIAAGDFPYGRSGGRFSPSPVAPDIEMLDPEIRQLFFQCFEDRSPKQRPTAAAWYEALKRAEGRLKRCRRNGQHRYGSHLRACPWCARAEKLGGRDYFPSQRAVAAGIHVAPPPPKQSPLPAVPSPAATAPAKARTAKASGRSKRRPGPARRWLSDCARNHPALHVGIFAVCGAAALGGARFSLGLFASPLREWMRPGAVVGAAGEAHMAAACLALGAAAAAAALCSRRPKAP